MPVTRSTGKRGGQASTAVTEQTETATETNTETTTETTADTCTTEATATTADTSDAPAATASTVKHIVPQQDAANATVHKESGRRSKPTSQKSNKETKARRIAKAKAELAQKQVELATARLAAIEAESTDEELSSIASETENNHRVTTWLQSSQLLAITNKPFEPEVKPSTEPVPVTAAVSWSIPATLPAGAGTMHPPPENLNFEHEPRNTAPSIEGVPPNLLSVSAAASWQPNCAPAQAHPNLLPVSAAASWQPNCAPAQAHPNLLPVSTAASWQPNCAPAQAHPNLLPVNAAASWQPNCAPAQAHPNLLPVSAAASWQPNCAPAQAHPNLLPVSAAASWQPNCAPAQAHPNLLPVSAAASWQPNCAPAQAHPNLLPVSAAASWQPNCAPAQAHPNPLPVSAAASWQPNCTPAQSHLNPPPVIAAASWRSNCAPVQSHPNPLPCSASASWQPTYTTAPHHSYHPGPATMPWGPPPMPSANVVHQPTTLVVQEPRTDMKDLAAAITQAVQTAQYQQPMKHSELPCFNGAHQDWLTFRAAYYETAHRLTAMENMARLRRNLRGIAKEAVQGLLIANANPDEVMKTLELRFGRPDSIAMAEIERLRTLPRLTESPRDVCTFATKVENIVGTLQALNCGHYLFNPEVTKAIIEKLTPTLKRQWYQFSATQPRTEPDLLKFTRFIKIEAEICSPYALPENITATAQTQQNTQRRQQRVHATQETNKPKCGLCERQGHNIIECDQFKKAATDARWDIAKKHRLCFRCLKFRSKQHSCKPKKCDIEGCVHFHNKMLHANNAASKKKEDADCPKEEKVHSAWTPRVSFLKIIPVQVSGPAGAIDTFALLDDGSTVTLIDESLADKIGAEGFSEPLRIASFDGESTVDMASRRVNFFVRGLHTSERKLQARTVKQLELAAQRIPGEAIRDCEHLRDIAKDIVTEDARPRLLIGQDNWDLLITTEIRTGKKNQPVASLTPLGWVLHGSHTRALGHRVNFIRHANTDDDLHELVKEYITMDNMQVNPKKPFNDPEEKALRILQKYTKRTQEGRYQTALLWRDENVKMPENYDSALNRLISVEKKIDKDPELKKRYSEQMEALVLKGYAEPAPPETSKHRTWYLPHFAVFNPMKPDKLRIVCDAAAKTRGVSLNDQLLTGPDLLQSLPGVIMRFRQHSIAVTADITEMFLQVELRPEDRDALRYLWRGDRRDDRPPEQYRMKSLIFGASCSPTTAIYVKNTNAERFQHEHPKAVEAIKRKHYMDDYLNSFDTLQEAVEVSQAVRDIHREAHFELKKWSSNSTALLEALGEIAKTNEETIKLEDSIETERVLGLIWKPNEDSLAFNLNLARIPQNILQNDTPTKREALRIVMSLFDPLGLVSPVTIRAKQILQEVWRRGTAWDETLDSDLASCWRKWLTHLRKVEHISIPRTYPGFSAAESLQLHVFTDASESAYAATIYWRTVTGDGRVHVCLVTAKAKVAPLKLMSIPRLELQAAVLGARMASAVKTEHERTPESTTFWTDSRTTLSWIRTGSRSYKPYVAHRIAAIEEHSSTNEWRWLPTKMNPADDATRDVPENYNQDHRWFNGPEFLRGPPETWPTDEKNPIIITGEERTCSVINNDKKMQIKESIPDVNRFSRWERYLRSTARVLQFLHLCRQSCQDVNYRRTKKNSSTDPDWRTNKKTLPAKARERPEIAITNNHLPLTAEFLRKAERLILRASQEQSFQEEIETLKNKRDIPRNSRLHALCVEFADGEIRLKSRITATAGIAESLKKPMVLDGDHRTTRLWIEHVHRQLHHAGVETTVNECRQQHWVLRLRPTVKNVISKCLQCRIKAASPPQPMTGNLPPCRLAHHQRPFTFTGLDYFGPLTITAGRSHQKRYVALFTWLTTRAIHLELVASLNTDSAIMALRRMIARRGCPTQLWSDNGTNFHGAEKELRTAIFAATAEEASKKMIDWRFIPPGAPFMGGSWERMVRSVKTALATTLNERFPSEEVLNTLLIEAEHTVNSRPLTHVSVNVEDPEALTPNHFILGGPGRIAAPGEFDDSDLRIRASWRAAQRLADIFWARWIKEYLPELQNRREPHTKGTIPKVGDLVLIVDGNLPRNVWIRGRICATFPGPDGVVRTVDVTTKGGILRRPVKKIVVLPIKSDSGDPAPASTTATSAADDARREECAGRPTYEDTTRNLQTVSHVFST